MGPLGTQELVAIFLLALLLFGPKKLPELAKTFAKGLKEFRKAQSDLKSTFDREMANLERETGIKELTATSFQSDSYNYDYSSYDSSYYDGSLDSTVTNTSTTGASAILGAGAAPLQIEAAPGSIANGHLEPEYVEHSYADHSYADHGYVENSYADHIQVPVTPPANGHNEPGHIESHDMATEKPVNS